MKSFFAFRYATSLTVFFIFIFSWTVDAEEVELEPATKLTVQVGNRLYPNFQETHVTDMHKRVLVGDTDYSFEVTEFFPHFAIIDSTKEKVSLTNDPKNVAFKFVVYENDSIVDTSWSFFNVQIPHYGRSSYLFFSVTEFEYRGEIYRRDTEEKSQ